MTYFTTQQPRLLLKTAMLPKGENVAIVEVRNEEWLRKTFPGAPLTLNLQREQQEALQNFLRTIIRNDK